MPSALAGRLVLAQRLPGAADRQAPHALGEDVGDQRQEQDDVVEEDQAVDAVERNAQHLRYGLLAGRRGLGEDRAEQGRAGDRADAGRTVGEVDPVEDDQPDDLAEAQGDDGEIVAAQTQHREAEQDAEGRRQHAGERQHHPEAQAVLRAEQRVGVGADGVEGDVAEIEQARQTDHDVEAPAQHHVGQDEHAEIHGLLVGERREGHHDGQAQQQPAQPLGADLVDHAPGRRAGDGHDRLVGPWPDGADHQQDAAQRHEPVQEARRQLHRRGAGGDHRDAERDGRPAQARRRRATGRAGRRR